MPNYTKRIMQGENGKRREAGMEHFEKVMPNCIKRIVQLESWRKRETRT